MASNDWPATSVFALMSAGRSLPELAHEDLGLGVLHLLRRQYPISNPLSEDHAREAISICKRLYPNHPLRINFIPDNQCHGDDGEPADAFALFPDDGAPPEIWISYDVPVEGLPDTIFHEFAHIVAGLDAGHGPEFEAVYQRLWEAMDAPSP